MTRYRFIAPAALTLLCITTAAAPTINNISAAEPENGVFLTNSGNGTSYCSIDGCVSTSGDHQRAAALFIATTAIDGQAQENTVGIETTVRTGSSTPWRPATGYAAGANAINGDAVYRAVAGGVSASGGSGPAGHAAAIADGSVTWAWINDSAIDAKVGLYNAVRVKPGGGQAWAQANNLVIESGVPTRFFANTELDLTNDAGDCRIGPSNCYGLFMGMTGAGTNTAWIALSGSGAAANHSIYQAHYGLLLSGPQIASDADINESASGAVGIYFGAFKPAAHATATILDASTSPVGAKLDGTYAHAAISTQAATTTTALTAAAGQKICWNGSNACVSYSPAAHKLYFTDGTGTPVLSIADGGHAIFKGSITQNAIP